MQVSFSLEAVADLESIERYVAEHSPAAASRLAVQLLAACDRLEFMPERGRPGQIAGTREVTTVWPYVILYQIEAGTVEILRIRHGAQDRSGA